MADFTYEGGSRAPVAGGGASLTHWIGAAASLALVAGIGVWGYGIVARDVSGVPVVQATAGPMRVAPEDPGGTLADHQGLAVNAVAGRGAAEGPADRLILAPVPAGLAAEDVALGALAAQAEPEPVPVSLADQAEIAALAPDGPAIPEDDPTAALIAELLAGEEPLTELAPLAEGVKSPLVTSVQDVSSAVAEEVEEVIAESETTAEPLPGSGLARSLRPVLRPAGLSSAQVASASPDEVVAAIASATQEIDPATLTPGTRLVQIGAFDSPETARAEWRRLETRFGEYLDGKGRVIQKATSGGRTFYRLRAEGFTDLSDARRFCAAFVTQNVDCIPVVTR